MVGWHKVVASPPPRATRYFFNRLSPHDGSFTKNVFPKPTESGRYDTQLGLREFLIGAGFFLVVVLVMAIMFLLEKYL
jgi:hypothetical protein